MTYRLVNFDSYIAAVESDKVRDTLLKEYQPTKIHYDGQPRQALAAMDFLTNWITGDSRWLTILGDYGVGKSWMLKRLLYLSLDKHKAHPDQFPLPFFVPLQRFTKAFDYQNLILRTFQIHGLAGVTYDAFEHLARLGHVLFLFDSFDEMAQHLNRDTIRENLHELLIGMSGQSKAIMTSRPTYFENRAERLVAVETDGSLVWHPLDRTEEERKLALTRFLSKAVVTSRFARLTDLSPQQRRRLFASVLGSNSPAYTRLTELLKRFEELGSISQRAVIARLLTTVAETLASGTEVKTIDGLPLLPDDLEVLNQGKIFEIVVHNLLHRDQQVGSLTAGDRYHFLRSFAIFLQQPAQHPFAQPDDIRRLVDTIFHDKLRRAESREQLLEQYYRTCRRHSGLTTEDQFQDTTGQLDLPVEEDDATSRVGFSHNSLREYLVADAFADYLTNSTEFHRLKTVTVSEAVVTFFVDLVAYTPELVSKLSAGYQNCVDSALKERLFRLLFGLINSDAKKHIGCLGSPANLTDMDLTGLDFGGLPLKSAVFTGSILPDTDLRNADLRGAVFDGTILSGTMLDGGKLDGADLSCAEIESIFVFDEFETRTRALLQGRHARQWLYSQGAKVENPEELNQLLGRPWYEAAREVTRTLQRRIAGSHQDSSLAKGTDLKYRPFAEDFVKHLRTCGILEDIKRGRSGTVVRVVPEHRNAIQRFNEEGTIDPLFQSFFEKYT
ncbi:MAG: NACHT domain-containing protein [Deltaproteobacteria bacterium]|nr:NACHT domain-containing protein [Deltaproteobacteria bacterium]